MGIDGIAQAVEQAVQSGGLTGGSPATGGSTPATPTVTPAPVPGAPYAVVVQIKTEIQRTGMKKEVADLSRLIGILRSANYRGYVALEYEAAEDPKTAIPRHVETLKKLMG